MLAQTHSALPVAVQSQSAARPGTQSKGDAYPLNDFAGLNYSDGQKAEMDKIHRDMESRKAMVAKDQTLTPDQKDAMLLGYTRMEYVQDYKVLLPDQQKLVRQRLLSRKASSQSGQKPSSRN
jgi:hypothetical protein